jgi:starch phosphorylase
LDDKRARRRPLDAGDENIDGEEVWRAHCLLKERLVAFIRHRTYHSRLAHGDTLERTELAHKMFDPAALTIGFARRVAAYKRWSLLLTDPQRLLRLINHADHPVQFVFAGKAHPQDQGAKLILQQLAQWKFDPLIVQRAVFCRTTIRKSRASWCNPLTCGSTCRASRSKLPARAGKRLR